MRPRDHKIFDAAKMRLHGSHIGYPRRTVVFAGWMRIVPRLLSFALFAFSPGAHAQPIAPIVVERGAGAERCPEAETLAIRVELIRGRPAIGLPAPYRISFARTDDRFVATIRNEATAGVRTLEHDGAQCAALGNAVALTLALLFDSDVAPPKIEPPLVPVPSTLAPAPPVAPPPPPAPRDVTVAIGGSAIAGVLRPVSPALVAEMGVRWDVFRVSGGAVFAWPSDIALGPGTVRQRLGGGLARFCIAPWQRGVLRLDACSGVAVAQVVGEAHGYTRNERHGRLWLAIPVEAALSGWSSRIGWEIAAAALLPIERPDFSIDGAGVAYASPPVGAMLTLRAMGIVPF
jgi:hypothetical protein